MSGIAQGLQRLAGFGFQPAGVLDIGAYEGWFARVARQVWPQAHIFMIEAMPEKAPLLTATVEAVGNSEFRIQVLGQDDNATVTFYVVHAGTSEQLIKTGSSIYPELTGYPLQPVKLASATLDSVLAETPVKFPFIKIDVQGAELDVLKGAAERLNDAEVVLLEISILKYNEGSPLIAEVVAYMKSVGFVVFDIVETMRTWSGHLIQIDALFIREKHALIYRFPGARF